MFSTFQAFKFLSCKLAFLTSDPRIDRLRHGSCDASEGEVQSAGVVVVVFSVHFIDQQLGPGHVVVFVHFIQYGLTTLEEEKKYKSGFSLFPTSFMMHYCNNPQIHVNKCPFYFFEIHKGRISYCMSGD